MDEVDFSVNPYMIPGHQLPREFTYPRPYIALVSFGSVRFAPWSILHRERALYWYKHLAALYGNPSYIPFAERQDNDDFAAWSILDPGKIHIIDVTEKPEWATPRVFDDLESWMRHAMEDMIEFMHSA
jgi:hypothetical protein